MADFRIVGTVDGSEPIQKTFNVASGAAATIAPGDLVVAANGYAAKCADAGCAAAGIYGMAVSTSTDTVAAAGEVSVVYSANGLIVRGAPTTPGNLAAAIVFDRVTLDVAAGTQKVDENDPNGILTIVDYDATSGQETIDVVLTATL